MNMELLRELINWYCVINVGVFLFSTVSVIFLGKRVSRIHARMFDIDPNWVRQAYFTGLANYKIFVLVFVIAPWLAMLLTEK